MDRFNALGRGTQIMLVAGVLLFISLFLNWQDFDPGGVDIGDVGERNGWYGFLGVLLGILTIALIAWIVVRMVAPQAFRLPFSEALVSAALGAAVVLIGLLKLISIISDEASIWAFVGFVLAVLVGVGAWMVVQSAGGIDTLKGELPSMSSGTPFEEAPPATTTPPPAAPSETAPQAAEPAPAPPVEPAPPEPSTAPEPDEPYRPRDE